MISTAYSSSAGSAPADAASAGSGWAISTVSPARSSRPVADQRARLGQRRVHPLRRRLLGEALDAQDDLHLDRRRRLQLLVDVPAPVGGLAPRRPVERDVGDHPRRLALAGQAVAGLPGDVAEQHVDLEVLLERLALEERRLERVAQRADGIGEDVVEHPATEATGARRMRPRPRSVDILA